MCVFLASPTTLASMNNENFYIDIPRPVAGFRVLPGLAIEAWDGDNAVTVRMTPSLALKIAQHLLFDAREALDKAESAFNAIEDRARAERIAAENQ